MSGGLDVHRFRQGQKISMLPAAALGMPAFLTQFDVTAVIIAMPAIAEELGARS